MIVALRNTLLWRTHIHKPIQYGRAARNSALPVRRCSSDAWSSGSSWTSIFESRWSLYAWISATRCLTVVPLTSSAYSRQRICPSTLMSWPFLESLRKAGEIAPSVDAVPLGAALVVALVVLPAVLGGDAQDNVLLLVLARLGFSVVTDATDEKCTIAHFCRSRVEGFPAANRNLFSSTRALDASAASEIAIYCIGESLRPFWLLDQLPCERLDRRRPMELLCSRITEVDPARVEALHHFDIEPGPVSRGTHPYQDLLPGSLR
jgi:hypothetical protein